MGAEKDRERPLGHCRQGQSKRIRMNWFATNQIRAGKWEIKPSQNTFPTPLPFFPGATGLPNFLPLPPQHHNRDRAFSPSLLKLGHTGLKDSQRQRMMESFLFPWKVLLDSPHDPLKDSPLFTPQHWKFCTDFFPSATWAVLHKKGGKIIMHLHHEFTVFSLNIQSQVRN